MNRLTFAAFVSFWACTLTVLSLSALSPESAAQDDESLPTYSLAEIAAHDSEESCWMAIEGRVYDLSEYLPQHPTPPAVLLPYCGTEATEGMRTKGYGRDHSPAGWAMLEEYLIGRLPE